MAWNEKRFLSHSFKDIFPKRQQIGRYCAWICLPLGDFGERAILIENWARYSKDNEM